MLEVKYSVSSSVPFGRLRVRIKREIIRMNHPAIRPVAARAPAVDAHTVERWLRQGMDDDGRPVVMLDTRNEFEVQAGTFANAINWHIDRFTQFPQAVLDHKDELTGKTVVSFCTGGIREKAAIFMAEAGVERVLQLDGGILKYFEETGGTGFGRAPVSCLTGAKRSIPVFSLAICDVAGARFRCGSRARPTECRDPPDPCRAQRAARANCLRA